MRDQRGFSLLEVLVAAAVLATALLGLGVLAMQGLDDAAFARDERAAGLLMRDLQGRVALSGGPAAWRSPAGQAAAELGDWRRVVARDLPRGDGTVCRDATPSDGRAGAPSCDGGGLLVGKVFWRRGSGGEAEARYRVLDS